MRQGQNPQDSPDKNSSATHEGTDELVPQPGSAAWWTGPRPVPGEGPGMQADGRVHSLPQPRLDTCTTESVRAYFDNGWLLTEVLFSGLATKAAFFRPPSHNLRHPLIFYYVHPAALYINKLRVAGLLAEPLDPYFEQLFETGVDEMSWDDLSKNEMEWPALAAAHAYRKACYTIIRGVIEHHPDLRPGHRPIGADHPLWALFMGFEHERIHLETSSVLIRELPIGSVVRPPQWPPDAPATGRAPVAPWRSYQAGSVAVGRPLAGAATYGWDNEFGRRDALVPAFAVTETMISNGDYHAFVVDGGYSEQAFWSAEGWRWRSGINAKQPTFWVPEGPAGLHHFALRTIFEVIPMPAEWPALVNYHEAKAYAAWRSRKDRSAIPYRLLTEAEHHRLRPGQTSNVGLRFGSESPVGGLAASDAEPPDVFGNAWQWCEDHFHGLPDFRVHRYYDDFSTPCFDGEHQMIMGGSFASTGGEASPFARFHFRPHFFQHAGFRLVRPEREEAGFSPALLLRPKAEREASYESEIALGTYCLLHFGGPDDTVGYPFAPKDALAFPQRCADLLVEWMRRLALPPGRAIDVGCAVGGAVFRLAETFDEVWGVDLSAKLIQAAKTLQQEGSLPYARKDEGDITTKLVARVDSPRARAKAHFRQADAGSLPPAMSGFDAVLASNLLCRMPSPKAFLSRLGGTRGLVRAGGLLLIASPFTWMERFTPREVWLGGTVENGVKRWSEDGLRAVLGAEFTLLERREMPLLIREHARKFEYIVPLVTVWQKAAAPR